LSLTRQPGSLTDPTHTSGASAVAPEPVTALPGVGDKLAEKLARLGVQRVEDLLFLLPIRYEDRTRLAEIGTLRAGTRITVEGHVELTEVVFRRRRMMLCRISDGSGGLLLRFFHFTRSQSEALKRGTRLRCFGEVRQGPAGLEMVHPEYRRLAEGADAPLEDSYTPVYPSTEGLGQGRVRRLVNLAVKRLEAEPPEDLLPPEIIRSLGYPSLVEALLYLHGPPVGASLPLLEEGKHPAQQRLAFEELLAQHLSLRMLRRKIRDRTAPRLETRGGRLDRFLRGLPFRLTGAQQRVLRELLADMASDRPMLRLVQGDVGSGKTVVAAAAAVVAASAGYQAAVMAPTELLAEQHYRNFEAWLTPLDLRVAWLAGRLGAAARRRALQQIGNGEARVAVGTHALFQEGVEFARLGLAIIDEQHRFGVHQRLALTEKGENDGLRPHQLVMTATPIPRTLAMASYADLDTSSIDELPPGRGQVSTVAVPASRRPEVLSRVRLACESGRQAYWVCPLIEESDVLQYQAAEETAAALAEALPGLAIGLVHGRMKAAEKQSVMDQFKAGRIQLLVATTVIEVGVDVPDASLMIIENSERMGLAQLHQLRGRVGRGNTDASCVLMYKPPLGEAAERRLRVLRETSDGFRIAEEDLRLRGPGEVLGTRQTGAVQMRVADIMRDRDLLPKVRQVADRLLASHSAVIPRVLERWVGEAARYGQV
jgi:ATP-dependent DNA helicase RecG